MLLRREGYTEEQTQRKIVVMVDSAIENGFGPEKLIEKKDGRTSMP